MDDRSRFTIFYNHTCYCKKESLIKICEEKRIKIFEERQFFEKVKRSIFGNLMLNVFCINLCKFLKSKVIKIEHFIIFRLLVGAPRAQSQQPGTNEAGAIFACDIQTGLPTRRCQQIQVEYPTEHEFRKPPQRLGSKTLHREGKNHQLLGFVVQSTGTKNGSAMVSLFFSKKN